MSESCHWAYPNCCLICSWCGALMDGSKSDHSVEQFIFYWICNNPTCAHVGIRYKMAREAGVKLERVK